MRLSGVDFDLRKDADIVLRKALPFALSTAAAMVLSGSRSRWGGVTVPLERFRWAPFYEFALLRGLKAVVEPGDTVIIVGGGLGVSSVVAAREAGPTGTVITYEGDAKRAATVVTSATPSSVHRRPSMATPGVPNEFQRTPYRRVTCLNWTVKGLNDESSRISTTVRERSWSSTTNHVASPNTMFDPSCTSVDTPFAPRGPNTGRPEHTC
jgi:hypothetical protein